MDTGAELAPLKIKYKLKVPDNAGPKDERGEAEVTEESTPEITKKVLRFLKMPE